MPLTQESAPDLVARLDSFFAETPGGEWVLWSCWPSKILETYGFTDFGRPPLMIRTDHAEPERLPSGLRVEEVTCPETLTIFDRELAAWYPMDGIDDGTRRPFFTADSLGTSHRYWVGYQGDELVTLAMAVVGAELVGIFAVATSPAARGKGYGGTITDVAARCVPEKPALLTSSDLGVRAYERIGFRKIGAVELWRRRRQVSEIG
jgi:GNAT superfamily N-acetyltransferase